MSMQPVITVRNLKKTYGHINAVDDISFEVKKGEIFGMVGPNGAGKTTTIECIEGLRTPDSGSIEVLGHDPSTEFDVLKSRIGIQLQQSALQERSKVIEILHLYAALYDVRIDCMALLKRLGLEGTEQQYFSKLSGGQKQRLFIALSLLHGPELVFLDELTTGLDPQARRNMWDLIREIRDEGKTVYITTHFMEEAERLCDRVAIVDKGRMIALDTPQALIHSLGGEKRLIFESELCDDSILKTMKHVITLNKTENTFTISGETDQMIAEVVQYLAGNNIAFKNLRTEQPNLEDVFLSVTGHSMEMEVE
ncbi:ABC transporter ATP-binding protein [bacterium]|nr:ABC transporter ATP-binding protein [bacterium]